MKDLYGNTIDSAVAKQMEAARYELPLSVTGIKLQVHGGVLTTVLEVALDNLSLVLHTSHGSYTIMLNVLPIVVGQSEPNGQEQLPFPEVGTNPADELIPPVCHDAGEQT